MKPILLFLHVLTFAFWLPANAQVKPTALDCYRTPNPIQKYIGEKRLTTVTENEVAVYYVVARDEAFNQAEYDAILKASREIQAWYQINTGGVTYTFALPDTVVFYHALESTSYYQDNWWDKLLPEMQSQGIPLWQPGIIASIWIKTGSNTGIGLGMQSCDGYCGVALAGVENFPEFNDSGICTAIPGGYAWPCVPHGTMAHELGHAFGLPHPDDPTIPENTEEIREVAFHSLMRTHWNYPDIAPPEESPWGLLTVERTHLWSNPFFMQGIELTQIYDADVVNLPVTGQVPTIVLDYTVSGRTITFTNNTSGAVLYYWTFGDGNVSNEEDPAHNYSSPGTYTVTLRASSETGMTALQELTVEISDKIVIDKKPKPTRLGPITIYPNPSRNGRFMIDFPPLPFSFQVTITNSMGIVLLSQVITDTSEAQQLDLSAYGSGMFYIRVDMKEASWTQKLVVF